MKQKFTLTYLLMLVSLGLFAQTISLAPNSANRGQSLPVTITGIGTNFSQGSNTVTFLIQGSPTNMVTMATPTTFNNTLIGGLVHVSQNAFVGSYAVLITNPQNNSIYLTNGFTVNGTSNNASLVSITPNTIAQGQNLSVTITGLNTNFASASNTLRFFKQGSESFDDIFEIGNEAFNNNILVSNIIINPSAATGVYTIGVQNNLDGLILLNNSFTVTQNNKSISLVNPNSGKQGQILNVTITGVNTNFSTGSPTFVFLNQGSETTDIEATSTTANSATEATINVRISATCPIATYDIGYFNPADGILIKYNAFRVENSTGMMEWSKNSTLLFPNPTKNKLFIENSNGISSIEVIDITGKILVSKLFENEIKTTEINLEDANIGKGIYFIKTKNKLGQEIKKLLVE